MITTGENLNLISIIIQLEQRIATLEKVVVTLNNTNENLPGFKSLDQHQYDRFVVESTNEVIAKYPTLGLTKKDEI